VARKEAEALKAEGLKLRGRLHEATQEAREVHLKVSATMRRLVTAQQGVTSQRASMGRKRMEILKLEAECAKKREELRALELDELTWMQRQDSTTLELIVLEEAKSEKQSMAMDLLTRLTSHLTGATVFQSVDIRARQEMHMEDKLAMDMARSAAQVVDNQMGLEETRKHMVKEALQLDQAARAKEVKSKQTAMIEAVAKEKAEKELKANRLRRPEGQKLIGRLRQIASVGGRHLHRG
jgi:hypothetical protein